MPDTSDHSYCCCVDASVVLLYRNNPLRSMKAAWSCFLPSEQCASALGLPISSLDDEADSCWLWKGWPLAMATRPKGAGGGCGQPSANEERGREEVGRERGGSSDFESGGYFRCVESWWLKG